MPFFTQCPFCTHKFSLPFTVVVTGCPHCHKTFQVDHLAEGSCWETSSQPAATEKEDKSASKTSPSPNLPVVREAPGPQATGTNQLAPKSALDPLLLEAMSILREAPVPPVAKTDFIQPAPETAPNPDLPEPIPLLEETPAPPATKIRPAPRIAPALPAPKPQSSADDSETDSPDWVNPWGLAAFALGVMALLLASLIGVRILTITLSALGVAAVVVGIFTGRSDSQTKGRVSLAVGGTVSAAVLFLALVVPGVINSRWALDTSLSGSDPNKQVVVPRDYPKHEGRALAEDEWVDAVKEAIRQDEVFIQVESIQVDRLADKGENKYVLVYLRLGNSGHERTISVPGFSKEKDQPKLTDDSGRPYPFLEQRPRKFLRGRGPAIFETSGPQVRKLGATGFLDQLLVFAAPEAKVGAFKLELPAAAWGRTGVCRFRSPGLFDAPVDIKKGKR